jgi:hypothetical protein
MIFFQVKQKEDLKDQMKQKIHHLQRILRLQKDQKKVDKKEREEEKVIGTIKYKPSMDAIEWHTKYEELEDNYILSQERMQELKTSRSFFWMDMEEDQEEK